MTAKEQFLMTSHKDKLKALIGQDYFREVLNFAMLHMQETMPSGLDPAKGWDCHSRMQGALQFRRILETLAEPDSQPKQDTSGKLRYDAYENSRRNNT